MLKKCLIILTLLWSNLLYASMIPDIYLVKKQVPSHETAVKQDAFNDALLGILKIATGRSELHSIPSIKDALDHSEQYVQRYSYELLDKKDNQWSLSIVFDDEKIEQLLKQANLPVWGSNRPVTMVWAVIQGEDMVRHLIGSDHPSLPTALLSEGKEWGIPLVLPIMDLTDITTVTPTDAWGAFREVLEEASERYASDAILILRLKEEGEDKWDTRWSLVVPGQPVQHWESKEPSLTEQITEGMAGLAYRLADQFALTDKRQAPVTLSMQVVGIQDYKDFSDLKRYLEGLDITASVSLTAMRKEDVLLSVDIYGGQNSILQALKLDNHLLQVSDTVYKWAP